MNRIWYGIMILALTGSFFAACQGGKIVLEGDMFSGICFTDEQCDPGFVCSEEGQCVASGDIVVGDDITLDTWLEDAADVSEDLAEVTDTTEEVETIECVPSDEVCDGIDNDCNGLIDDELGELSCGVGECAVTVAACVDGVEQECVPGEATDEVCDGLDNDCNGAVDDNLGTLTCGLGICFTEVAACVDGQVQDCIPGDGMEEACDALDNDCNGEVDDGLGETTCGVGACQVTVANCQDGTAQDCVPGESTEEICDGLDNDCDGESDEELGTTTCGTGECEVTVENCVAAEPIECIPLPPNDEECDGLDNDCDGEADEELGSTTCGLGLCEVTVENCVDGVAQECVPGAAGEEICDELDNDCDGETDEELGSTTCGIGACSVTVDNCIDGVTQQCLPGQPGAELCDTIDNDCDGDVDNMGFLECGIGACYNVVPVCDAGELLECVPGQPMAEVCDYVDNDCNGVVDDPQECQTVVIFGRTYNAVGGEGIADATVTLKAAGDCALDDDGGPALLVLKTGEKGGYSIDGFAGSYCLEAEAEGYQKMIAEDFSLDEGDIWQVDFPMAMDGASPFVGLCGRVADADTLIPLGGASVLLGASSPDNVVASAQTNGDGLYCMGGVLFGAAQDWYGAATYPEYMPGAQGPFQFETNVVKFVSYLLAPELEMMDCYADDFEVDTGWLASPPSGGAFWQQRINIVTPNTAVPNCVTVAPDEVCMPDPQDPQDICPICLPGQTNNCIPQPGALPYSYDGNSALWYGVPSQGNYGGEGMFCADGGGGTGDSNSGTYTSPAIELLPTANNLAVTFWYWYEIEGVDPNTNFDKMQVNVSTDGIDFQQIGVLNPSIDTDGNPDQAYTSAGFFKAPRWAWTALPLGEQLTAEVAAAGQMYVQYSFSTGDGAYNGFRGWLVDGLKVKGIDCIPKNGTVSGLIYDADQGKAPVGGAAVTVKAAGDCDGNGPGGDALFTTTSGENGFYTIELPPGEYCIEVESQGYAKMVTDDFVVEPEEQRTIDFGLQPGNVPVGYVSLCGRIADADTLELLAGASAKLAATSPLNVVASSQSNEFGFFCIGGVKISNATNWFAIGSNEGYLTSVEGPIQFEANKVKFVNLLLAKDTSTTCLQEGFEQDNGWVADAPSSGVVWQRFQSQTLLNQAVVNGCVQISAEENCTPDLNDPNDPCPICQAGETGCIPSPGALSLPFDGQFAAWFGHPQNGNFLSDGASCPAQSGGEGATVFGNFTSPAIVVPPTANDLRLTFWYWFEIEGVDPNQEYDRMEVYVSTNGTDFQNVAQLNPSVDTDGAGDEPYTSAGFLQVPSWNKLDQPLPAQIIAAALASGQLWVRFTFNSGDGAYNGFRGWMVDNVQVRGTGCE